MALEADDFAKLRTVDLDRAAIRSSHPEDRIEELCPAGSR